MRYESSDIILPGVLLACKLVIHPALLLKLLRIEQEHQGLQRPAASVLCSSHSPSPHDMCKSLDSSPLGLLLCTRGLSKTHPH